MAKQAQAVKLKSLLMLQELILNSMVRYFRSMVQPTYPVTTFPHTSLGLRMEQLPTIGPATIPFKASAWPVGCQVIRKPPSTSLIRAGHLASGDGRFDQVIKVRFPSRQIPIIPSRFLYWMPGRKLGTS